MAMRLFSVEPRRLGPLALLLCAGLCNASTINFTFSFTNSTGNIPGTVTGEILGLNDNSTGAATQVLIDSYPGAFNPTPFSLPINATLFPNQFQNTFTVASGVITSARFDADTLFSPTPPDQYILNFTTLTGQFFDTTNFPTCCSIFQNTTGPISFAQAAVPEPASVPLVLGGLVWLLGKRIVTGGRTRCPADLPGGR